MPRIDLHQPLHLPVWFPRLSPQIFRHFAAFMFPLPRRTFAWLKRKRRSFAVAAVMTIALWIAGDVFTSMLLNREISAMRQRGEPTTWNDIKPDVLPAMQNAAILYEGAWTQLKFDGDDNYAALHGTTTTGQALSDAQIAATKERVFRANAGVTQLLEKASRLPKCVLDTRRDNRNFDETWFRKLAKMRQLARFLCAQASYEAQRDNTTAALQNVAVVYRMSEHMTQQPTFMALLVGVALEAMGNATLADVLDHLSLTPQSAEEVALILSKNDWNNSYLNAVRSDRVLALPFFTDWRQWSQAVQDSETALPKSRVVFEIVAPLRKLDARQFLRLKLDQSNNIPWYNFMLRQIAPSYKKAHGINERTKDMQQAARIALALNVWHTQYKTYPKSLNILNTISIAGLQSALKCKTIGYRTEGDEYLLYSFGPNRRDDGGKTTRAGFDDYVWQQSIGALDHN